jgi:hypothetical protein
VAFSEKVKIYFLGGKLVENNLENVVGKFYTSKTGQLSRPLYEKWSKKVTFFKTHRKMVMVIIMIRRH